MKKLLLLFVLLTASIGVMADNYSRDASVLPTAARNVLAKNFKSKVSLIKIEKELGRTNEYEVILTDGSEITFDRNGNWNEVEVRKNASVPSGFVPAGVYTYIRSNHKGAKVIGIEKKRNSYEVELSNGIDMQFDLNGKFLKYD